MLCVFKQEGIEGGIFGDIDFAEHPLSYGYVSINVITYCLV